MIGLEESGGWQDVLRGCAVVDVLVPGWVDRDGAVPELRPQPVFVWLQLEDGRALRVLVLGGVEYGLRSRLDDAAQSAGSAVEIALTEEELRAVHGLLLAVCCLLPSERTFHEHTGYFRSHAAGLARGMRKSFAKAAG